MTDKEIRDRPPAIFRYLVKLQNPFMKWLLRSPFHSVVSNVYMLITFTGRKSGKRYTTPVQYAQEGDTVYIITSAGYVWWKNLRSGTTVDLYLKGQTVQARANTSQDQDRITELAQKIYPNLSDDQRENFVRGKVAITVQLQVA